MALTLNSYVKTIKQALNCALCLRDFPSELIEKHNKPEIEMFSLTGKSKFLVLNPIFIARNSKEKCLIEPSINSCRISFAIGQSDDLDKLICQRFTKFFQVRADQFDILRRVALEGYDCSFLITDEHLSKYSKTKIIDFLIDFLISIDKDLSEIKLNIITQTRIAATFFLNQFSN